MAEKQGFRLIEPIDTTDSYRVAINQNAEKTLDELDNKVDKITGKGLSTNDYTTAEKDKLTGIADNANNYTHPENHPYSMITGTPSSLPANGGNADTVNGHTVNSNVPAGAVFTDTVYTHPDNANTRHVSDSEKSNWSNKSDSNHTHADKADTATVQALSNTLAELENTKADKSAITTFSGTATKAGNMVTITVSNNGKTDYTVTFTAPSNFNAPDMYRINGTAVTLTDLNNKPLKNAWVQGSAVTLSVVGNKAFFKAGGEFSSGDLLPMDRVEIIYDDNSDYDITQTQAITQRSRDGYFYNGGDFFLVISSSKKDICKVSTATNTLISKITDDNLLDFRVANELIFGIKANGVFDIYDFGLNKLQTITLTDMKTSRYDEILINYFDNRYLFTCLERNITTDQNFSKIAYRLTAKQVYYAFLISIYDGFIFTHECVMDKDLNVMVNTSSIDSDMLKAQPILNSNYYIKPVGLYEAKLYQYNKTANTLDFVKDLSGSLWRFTKAIKLGNKILMATGLNNSDISLSRTYFHEIDLNTLNLKYVTQMQGSLQDSESIPNYGFTQFKGGFAAVGHDSFIIKYIPKVKAYKIIGE